MQVLLILGVTSFLFALVLTPICRDFFRRVGMVDHPDQARKLHTSPVPNMGGVPLVLAYFASFGLVSLLGWGLPIGTPEHSLALRLVPALAIIFFTGLLDDRVRLQPVQKLVLQIVAAEFAFWAGVRITGVADHSLPVWLSYIITTVWLIICTNAFNLIDGVDGLAAGVGLFATATTLIAALLQHNTALALATVPLAGALVGFLRYNFNPATIFLGDSGSLFLGFILGCFGAVWSQKSATILGMTAPLMALSIPILDVFMSIARRFLRRQPIFRGDRGHIHHRLLDRGLTPRRVVLLLYGLCGVGAVFSLFQSMAVNRYSAAVILVFCAITWIGIQNLGYAEFDQARRMILSGGFRRALNAQLALRAFDESLAEAKSSEERWAILQEACRQFGFVNISWHVGEREYYEALWDVTEAVSWSLRVPLAGTDFINFTRVANMDDSSINVGALVEIVRKALTTPPEQRQIAPVSVAQPQGAEAAQSIV